MTTAPASWPLAAADEDTAAAAAPIGAPLLSSADENQVEEPAEILAEDIKEVDKGKGGHQSKHGVMSLPAEIRETYAFQSSAWHQ